MSPSSVHRPARAGTIQVRSPRFRCLFMRNHVYSTCRIHWIQLVTGIEASLDQLPPWSERKRMQIVIRRSRVVVTGRPASGLSILSTFHVVRTVILLEV